MRLTVENYKSIYQPQIQTKDHKMIGVEALLRWNHPTKGFLPPSAFIPLAEESGIIYELDDWVLREACRQMKEWQDAGGPLIPVAVNLSANQFHQLNLVDKIKQILEMTGLEAQYLVLEITESMMMDIEGSSENLIKLSDLGIKISLDDFGTGYSSLSYLRQLRIHKLKIDKSFITGIAQTESNRQIVSTIIAMAYHLKMDVIAEGVETREQLEILTEMKCMEIQGYYFSAALSAINVEEDFFMPMRVGC
ncbi:EAL domain-containing protein [Paenibacillus psychroresistens]|uniref:EAL domain-containing protein n=1 Tax=Paenibacillus psychroresistens TaxID=1778678 RepID=A0A6B8RUR6_9BACL|nr:EAL domain-containing protein [Paenibacillus psychroresistens]QGQ99677.1 EAL domain-containing protein [Paenibacillus psychroresistens]